MRFEAVGEALPVALEHLDVGEQVMREQHRLRRLQMRVAGHDDVGVCRGERGQARAAGRCSSVEDAADLVAQVQAQVERHLVVAAARRVQLAAGRADLLDQPPLDGHVDVLVGRARLKRAALELACGSAAAPR